MNNPERRIRTLGVTRISRETERKFFFYATLVMFLVWVYVELFPA